jgi:hypothetical protein
VTTQEDRFAAEEIDAPQAIPCLCEKGKPGGPCATGVAGSVMSGEDRFGARCLERLLMSNWCFSSKASATTARMPPRRSDFAAVTSRWITSIRSSRTGETYHGR